MSRNLQTAAIIASLSFRNLFRNKRRTILTLLAILVGVWSALGLSALARGLSQEAVDDSINTLLGHGQIHAPLYIEDPSVEHSFLPTDEIVAALKANPKISNFTARIKVPAVALSERHSVGVSLVGITPADEVGLSFLPDAIKQGRYFQNDSEDGAIVGEALLEELDTAVGRRIVLMSTATDDSVAERGVRIIATFKASLDSTEKALIFLTKRNTQQLLKLGENVSLFSFRLHDRDELNSVISELQPNAPTLTVTPWTTLEPLLVAVTNMQSGFLRLWFFIVVLAISFGLINTLFMSIFERKREFYLLEALGMKPKWTIALVVAESFFLLTIGVAAGTAIAVATVIALQNGIDISKFSEGTEMLRAPSIIIPRIVASDWIFANSLILGLGLVGSFYPAWRAASRSRKSTTKAKHG